VERSPNSNFEREGISRSRSRIRGEETRSTLRCSGVQKEEKSQAEAVEKEALMQLIPDTGGLVVLSRRGRLITQKYGLAKKNREYHMAGKKKSVCPMEFQISGSPE